MGLDNRVNVKSISRVAIAIAEEKASITIVRSSLSAVERAAHPTGGPPVGNPHTVSEH
jgi:hypothetical protein